MHIPCVYSGLNEHTESPTATKPAKQRRQGGGHGDEGTT